MPAAEKHHPLYRAVGIGKCLVFYGFVVLNCSEMRQRSGAGCLIRSDAKRFLQNFVSAGISLLKHLQCYSFRHPTPACHFFIFKRHAILLKKS
jgi:hypothetical protein